MIRFAIEGYSKPRNPAIANAFAYMKIIEKWGTGIPRIFRECRDYGLPDPELIDFDGDFRVNMYRNNTNKASNESLNSDEAVIMAMIKTNPQISQKEMVTKSGFSRSKIQRILKVLQGKKSTLSRGCKKKWLLENSRNLPVKNAWTNLLVCVILFIDKKISCTYDRKSLIEYCLP